MKGLSIMMISLFFSLGSYQSSAMNVDDTVNDKEVQEVLKKQILKNGTFFRMYLDAKVLQRNESTTFDNNYHLKFPGFGYPPTDLDIEIERSKLKYPKAGWTLYEVTYPLNNNNRKLFTWWGKDMSSFLGKQVLIGVNSKYECKYISGGYFFKNPIAQDFDLDPANPGSYIEFLKMRLFYLRYDSISYVSEDGGKLIFHAEKEQCEGVVLKFAYTIDINSPDLPLYGSLLISDNIYCPVEVDRPYQLEFAGFSMKQQFLLDALTRNIYLKYLLDHLDEFLLELDYDSNTQLIRKNNFNFIPDCDEFFEQFHLDKEVVDWKDKASLKAFSERKYIFESPILEKEKGQSIIYGYTKTNRKFEFYGFYRFDRAILFKKKSKAINGVKAYRYAPMLSNNQQDEIHTPPDSLTTFYLEWMLNGSDAPVELRDAFKQNLKMYLLAIDVKTNQIYFLSGDDIILSKASSLYGYYGKDGLLEQDMRKWDRVNKLSYIKDRLLYRPPNYQTKSSE